MKLHLATANTAQLLQQLNQIYSNKFLSLNREDTFSERCHIHQTEKIIRLLQSAANRQGKIKWYLLWHAVFPTDSFAVWQQNRNIKCTNQPSQCIKNSFSKLCSKNSALSLWNRKSQSWEFTFSFCSTWSSRYYFIMTEPLWCSYWGLSAFPSWITMVSRSRFDANL